MTVPFQLNPNRGQTLSAQAQSNGAGRAAPFTPRSGAQNTQADDKPKTQVWANLVRIYSVPVSDKNPEGALRISLPYGLAVDTMNVMTAGPRATQAYIDEVVEPRNTFLGKFVEKGMAYEPGHAQIITPLPWGDGEVPETFEPFYAIELRRVEEAAPKQTGSSDIASMIASLPF